MKKIIVIMTTFICLINTILFNSMIEKYNSFKLVSVARLSHAKGIDIAVKALKLLHDRGLTNIKWYVVGYGGDEEMIRKIIRENNLEDSFIFHNLNFLF